MRLLLALLLGNAAANPLISLVSKAKKLATAKNLGLGAVTPVIAGGLNTLREAAGDAEDKRQGVKASLREKAAETAQYVVWRHRNQEETSTQVCTKIEFCKMMATAWPIMRKKLRRRGRLARWFSTSPPEELVEIYVREEIAKVLRDDGVTLEDGECCPPWTKENFGLEDPEEKIVEEKEAAGGWSLFPSFWGTAQAPEEPTEPEAPEGKKVVKRVLVAVASALLGVALLPFK